MIKKAVVKALFIQLFYRANFFIEHWFISGHDTTHGCGTMASTCTMVGARPLSKFPMRSIVCILSLI